ncbi:unnamed protein product, partial [Adineta steineri]
DAHMPSPYLDAAPRQSLPQSGGMRGRSNALQASNRPAIGYDQYSNPSARGDSNANTSQKGPMRGRGPLRGNHQATEE